MSSPLNPEARRILKSRDIPSKQYLAWAMTRYYQIAWRFGITLTAVVFGLFVWMAAVEHLAAPGELSTPIAMLLMGLFVSSIFGGVALSFKRGKPVGTQRAQGFEGVDVRRRTSVAYLKGLSEAHWRAISSFDIEAFQRAQAKLAPRPTASPAQIERWTALKVTLKRIGIWGTGTFVALLALMLTLSSVLEGWSAALLVCAYLPAVTGLHGWIFLYGYIGFRKREIKVAGEFRDDDTVYTGVGAIIWALVAMVLSGLSWLLFLSAPVALFFY